ASYLKMNNPGLTTTGAIPTGDLFDGASQQTIGLSASYRFPKVAVAAAWSHVDVYDPTGNVWLNNTSLSNGANWNSWKFDNFELNSQYFFTPTLWLGTAYTFTMAHLSSTAGSYVPKWHQISVMLDYDLSKRTSLYVQGAWQHVVSAHTGTDFDEAQIVDASAGASSGVNQMVYRVGIMHKF
ncbi:MAG: porin, partial [Paraburkholderia tropica]